MEAHYLVEGENVKAGVVNEFVKVFRIVEHEIFNEALYQIKQKRNRVTRKPANLPDGDVVLALTNYLKQITSKENVDLHFPGTIFVEVRDASCTRLTVYNGRRGGEPARMFLYQWQEAVDGVWLRLETRERYQKEIDRGSRITYQEGKGNRQVPIFIPSDLVTAIVFFMQC